LDYNTNTPFIGIYNDNLEIYAQLKDDTITLSDDGATVANLSLPRSELKTKVKGRI